MPLSRPRLAGFLFLFLVLGFGAWCLYGYLAVSGIESPTYTVESVQSGYEIRNYDARIIATTTVEGDLHTATVDGFKRVAAYIFGGNAMQQEIAMTTPVTTEQANEEKGNYSISFVMPAAYGMDSLPLPTDASVRVQNLPAARYAVLTFSGIAEESTVDTKMQELENDLDRDGFTVKGTMILAQYNPPYTPWFMRRNEIWAELVETH